MKSIRKWFLRIRRKRECKKWIFATGQYAFPWYFMSAQEKIAYFEDIGIIIPDKLKENPYMDYHWMGLAFRYVHGYSTSKPWFE